MKLIDRIEVQDQAEMFRWDILFQMEEVWQDWFGVFLETPMDNITNSIAQEVMGWK